MRGERVSWLGHATALLELGACTLLTDPVLRPRIAHLRRYAPVPALPARVDAVLLSHGHRDHLDLASLARIDPTAPLLAPRGTRRALRRTTREVRELEPGESTTIAGARITATPADHDARHVPWGPPASALGFVVAKDHRVYFAGDTGLFAGMSELAGQIDVALLPIWGWGASVGSGHLDPAQAAQAAALIAPRIVIPIHWGTYLAIGLRRRDELMRRPPQRFVDELAAVAPQVRPIVLAAGQSLALG